MIPTRTRLLLDACLRSPEPRREAWSRWLDLTRFEDIDAGSHALLPSVAYFNRDEPFAESNRLRGLFRHNWAVNQERLRLVLPALGALQQEGLEPVLIKGAALTDRVYGSLGARRMADVDVLVVGGRFEKAADVLSRKGFSPGPGYRWPQASVKSWGFVGPQDAQLDLHDRPLQAPWDSATESMMRDRASQVTISDLTFPTLSDSANLVVALVHGMQYDGRWSHQWVLDAALLIRLGGVDWKLVYDIAWRLELEFAVSRGLRTVASWLPPGSIPASVLVGGFHPRQRIEQSFRTREPGGLLGALPNLYFMYRRERHCGLWSGSFGKYLREVWLVRSDTSLGAVLLTKSIRRAGSIIRAPNRRPL